MKNECLISKDLTFKRGKAGGRTAHIHIELKPLKKPVRNYTDLSLVDISQAVILTITANIRGCGSGQIVESFEKYIPFFENSSIDSAKKIASIWRNYHLNNFQPGTKLQMDCLKENSNLWKINNGNNYDHQKRCLENRNLLINREYQYGTGFLYKSVPQDIIDFIYSL